MAVIIPRTQGPQVQQQGIPSVRNTVNVDMSGVVRAGLAVQGAAVDYLKRQQDINDTTAVMKARRELSDWEANTFDPANPDGIAKYKGKDALGANDALLPSLDARVSEIRGGLTARQQQQFDGVAANFRDSLQGRLNGYMDREHSAYLSAEQKAAIDNIGQDAVSAGVAGDFGRQDQVANEALAMNRARRAAEGMGEELVKAEERGIVSSIRSQTIEGMLTARPFEAQAYFERYADQMSPEDRAKVERSLYPVVSDAQAGEQADAIMAGTAPQQYRDPGTRGRGPAPAVAKILDEEADAAGVPREYLYALAEQESGFNPKAVNREVLDDGDQATGLFQYRKTSAGGIDRMDARASARRAAKEFAARSKQGGVEFAVAAHFAGEGGADAVVNRGRSAENPKTAQYVQQVMGRATRWSGGDVSEAVAVRPPSSEADAIEKANAIRDPRQRAAVVGKIRERFNLADLRRQEQDRALSESSYQAIYGAQDPTRPLRELIGADAYARAVRGGHVEALDALRKKRIEGGFVQDDAKLVETLRREAVLSPATFAKRDLYPLASRLSTDTLGQLLTDQKTLNDPKKAADKKAQWATESTLLDIANNDLGITGKDHAEQRVKFQTAFLSEKRAFIDSHNGRAPTADEMQTIINRLKLPMFKAGWLWGGSEKAAFEADPKEGFDVPPAERQKIMAVFAEAGATPTDNEVREYYLRNVGKSL